MKKAIALYAAAFEALRWWASVRLNVFPTHKEEEKMKSIQTKHSRPIFTWPAAKTHNDIYHLCGADVAPRPQIFDASKVTERRDMEWADRRCSAPIFCHSYKIVFMFVIIIIVINKMWNFPRESIKLKPIINCLFRHAKFSSKLTFSFLRSFVFIRSAIMCIMLVWAMWPTVLNSKFHLNWQHDGRKRRFTWLNTSATNPSSQMYNYLLLCVCEKTKANDNNILHLSHSFYIVFHGLSLSRSLLASLPVCLCWCDSISTLKLSPSFASVVITIHKSRLG